MWAAQYLEQAESSHWGCAFDQPTHTTTMQHDLCKTIKHNGCWQSLCQCIICLLWYCTWTATMFFFFTSCLTIASSCHLPILCMTPEDDMWFSIIWLTVWATCQWHVSTHGPCLWLLYEPPYAYMQILWLCQQVPGCFMLQSWVEPLFSLKHVSQCTVIV